MHREVSMHESRPEQQQTNIRAKRVSNCYIPIDYTYLVRIRTFTKIDFPFDEIYRRLLFFTLGRIYHTLLYQVFVYSLVVGGTHDTYVPPKKQLYCYLFIRWWVVVRMIPMFRPRNSCIAICLFVSGCWYHTNVPPVDAHV